MSPSSSILKSNALVEKVSIDSDATEGALATHPLLEPLAGSALHFEERGSSSIGRRRAMGLLAWRTRRRSRQSRREAFWVASA
jgi:hypothetical protein